MIRNNVRMTTVKRIPKEVQDYFDYKYPLSEGYTIDHVYHYHNISGDKKYYGICIYKNGKLDTYPQDTLEGFAKSTPLKNTQP